MTRTDRSRSKRRRAGWAALAAAALAAPAVAHAIIQRRLRAPDALGWGRTHRYAGHLGQVVFQELGAGPPIVLLHALGPGYDSRQWGPAAEALASHFRVLAPDLPGWGRSAAVEPWPELYLAGLAELLVAVVREPAVLVAAGHAAAFAVSLAAELPDQIRTLALVAPAGRFAGAAGAAWVAGPTGAAGRLPAGQLVADLLEVPLLRVSALDALTSRAALAHHLRRHAYAAPERVDAALIEHHYRVSHLPEHRQALAAYWRGELDLPTVANLSRLRMPVWIGWGAASPAAEPAHAAAAASSLPPGSRIEILHGSRELPHAEQPLAFSHALTRFIAQLPGAQPA
jgi:pimeloyl-ACP methyl ester carboxylesterase